MGWDNFYKIHRKDFLSDNMVRELKLLWNLENPNYPWTIDWATGIKIKSIDDKGNIIYKVDFRDDWYLNTLDTILECKERGLVCG